ncbi:hypothetical protein ACFVAD_23050 [Sutcliffiella sp. NPDC057660]|uniref:hypothetical protein n=1 Tax=Sutcliffiella sp. NPDC057660 TaxID=3346199 RepID=UPI0036A31348
MWELLKQKGNLFIRICLVALIIFFIIFVFLTLAIEELNQNSRIITYISLFMVLFSIPSVIEQFAKEFNPKKKVYKLSSKCPKCKHLIQMDMRED